MTTIDRADLRAKAEAAFPGEPWAIWTDLTDGGYLHVGNAQGVIPAGAICTSDDTEPNLVAKVCTPDLADHIAAFDPPTALALLDALDAAEAKAADQRQYKREAHQLIERIIREVSEAAGVAVRDDGWALPDLVTAIEGLRAERGHNAEVARDRRSELVEASTARDQWESNADAAEAELVALRAQVERVRKMHEPTPEYKHIIACSCGWWSHDDCPHARALDGGES